jgi:hypothetical protein
MYRAPDRTNRRGSRAVKTLYLREDRILERIRTRLTRRMHMADPRTIADYFRGNNLIVTCTTRTCIIEDADKDQESEENGERRTAPTRHLTCGNARPGRRFVGVCVSKPEANQYPTLRHPRSGVVSDRLERLLVGSCMTPMSASLLGPRLAFRGRAV